jgi:predicted RNase H-like nuclease (RuvC/YqgF family)
MIATSFLQIDDLNALLARRQRHIKRLSTQLERTRERPEGENITLPKLASQAALAGALTSQNEELSAENEALRQKLHSALSEAESRGPAGSNAAEMEQLIATIVRYAAGFTSATSATSI